MIGTIYLVRMDTAKVVPAICLQTTADTLTVAQLRSANEEDLFNTNSREFMERYNRGRMEKDQIHIREKFEMYTAYLGQPAGLKSKSVAMLSHVHTIHANQLVKKLAQVSEEYVTECLRVLHDVERRKELQQELHLLKRKVQLAQFNNERYEHYNRRIEKLLHELGYSFRNKKKSSPYLHYREVPNSGYIKVYKGGR